MIQGLAGQRLASKIGIQQAKQLSQADAVGDKVDAKVLARWYSVLRILKEYERTKRIDPTAQRRLAELLHGMTADSIKGVGAGLMKLAKDAHKATVSEVVSEAPRSVLTLALQQKGDLTEAKLTPEQQAQVKAQLFDPLDEQATSQIVFAPSATTSWQARIAAQTKLAPPDQVAALVIQGMAAGQTVQQLAKSIEPAVQGVRTSARRVARTEGMRVAHAARLQAFDDLGDMVIGYQIHATMDWRVRPHHAARNGNIYYKNPGAGQLSVAEMPHPPIEEDGTVAFNCRCYLTPVFDADPVIENDPALKALFTDNDKKLVSDPVVYSEWFNNATEQERKWAVGVRRLAAAKANLQPGEELTWAHVLDPETGQLIPADKLQMESEADRLERIQKVNEVMDRRRDLAVQISRFGYIQDPNPPPAPAPLPDQPPAPLAPEQPPAPPPPPPLPLPDYITDVDALMAKLADKKFTNQIYKNLLVHDGQPLISKHYWMQYKAGKLSARTLANIYNKNLAKLKGDTPPEKFNKQRTKIVPPPRRPQAGSMVGQWFETSSYFIELTSVQDFKTFQKYGYRAFDSKGPNAGKYAFDDSVDDDDLTALLMQRDWKRIPGQPQAVTDYLAKRAADKTIKVNTWWETDALFYHIEKIEDTPNGKEVTSGTYHKHDGSPAGKQTAPIGLPLNSIATGKLKPVTVQPMIVVEYFAKQIPGYSPQPSAPAPVTPSYKMIGGIEDINIGDWIEAPASYMVVKDFATSTIKLTRYDKKSGKILGDWEADNDYVSDALAGGSWKALLDQPAITKQAAAQAAPQYAVGDWFQVNGVTEVWLKMLEIGPDEVKLGKYDNFGDYKGDLNNKKDSHELALKSNAIKKVPPPPWAAPLKTAITFLPWRDALQQAKQEDPHAGVWGPAGGYGTSYGGILFDDEGRVLLRKPTGNYDGYHWTWPKGKPGKGDHPADAAVRETEEETGHKGSIVGYLPGGFSSDGPAKTHFYMMKSAKHDPAKMDTETAETQWVTLEEAEKLINETTKEKGKQRDLQILMAVKKHLQELSAGKQLPKAGDPAPPPPALVKTMPPPAPPKAPITVSPPPPDLHDQARWNRNVGPNGRKPAVGLPLVGGKRQAYKPPLPPLGRPIKPVTHAVQFPDRADKKKLSYVQGLGGGTGAELVIDNKTNARYVRKSGASPDHLREEVAADKLYAACGVRVPAVEIHEEDGKPVKLAEFVTGKTLKSYLSSASPTDKKKILKKIQGSFAADALLGNWDVAGANFDNIMVDEQGEPIRIDNGGSLRFRALGTPKGKDWNAHPTELWSLTDEKLGKNPQTAEMFKDMKWSDVLGQMEKLIASKDQILKAAPDDETKEMLGKRMEQFEDIVATSDLLLSDGWSEEYVKEFTKHQQYFRQNGTVGKLPNRLGNLNGTSYRDTNNAITDENGEPMDDLRGDGRTKDLIEYITRNGGSWEFISAYASSQAGSSWNTNQLSMGMKALLFDYRPGAKKQDFYWKRSFEDCKEGKEKLLTMTRTSESAAMTSVAAVHAFNQEMLRNIDMPNNNRANGTFRLYRTEHSDVISFMKDPATGAKVPMPETSRAPIRHSLKRGALESYSAMSPIEVHGDRLTVLEVPHHRIIMGYFLSRSGNKNDTFFLGDRENEFVAMTDGIDGDYHGRGYSS